MLWGVHGIEHNCNFTMEVDHVYTKLGVIRLFLDQDLGLWCFGCALSRSLLCSSTAISRALGTPVLPVWCYSSQQHCEKVSALIGLKLLMCDCAVTVARYHSILNVTSKTICDIHTRYAASVSDLTIWEFASVMLGCAKRS